MAKTRKSIKEQAHAHRGQIPKGARKDEIIKAAAKLFSQKSYHDVTMDDIAEKVGVAKGPIYLEIMEETYEEIESILERETAKSDPAPVKLKKVLGLIFKFYLQNLDVLRILSRDETHLIREHYEFTEHWRLRRIKLYEKILEKGINEGSFRPFKTELTALIIFGLVRSVMFYYKSEKSAESIAEEVFSMISEGILAPGYEKAEAARM
jgi:AcrR family transcriptional regulator